MPVTPEKSIFPEDFYRVNLVDEHAEVGHIRVVPAEIWMARFHAIVVRFLDLLGCCIRHLKTRNNCYSAKSETRGNTIVFFLLC